MEIFPIVNNNDEVIGSASRSLCHSGCMLLHQVVHLHIFNSIGQIYLQKRALTKDIQPGKWDTAVGGHVDYGETVIDALHREVSEELGIENFKASKAFFYIFKSSKEHEYVHSFYTVYDGKIIPDKGEITEGKYWDIEEIVKNIGHNIFTPNFENEFSKIQKITNF